MKDYYMNRYVPKSVIDKWTDESRNVYWYNPLNKNGKDGKGRDFFCDKITGLAQDEIDYVEALDGEIHSFCYLDSVYDYEMKDEDPLFRSSILFSYMRTPSYQMYTEGIDGSMVNLKGESAGKDGRRSGAFMSKLLQIISSGELSIMDLKYDELYSAHRRFILPSSSFNIINPYIGDNLTGYSVNLNPFILKGAFFIIPVSPCKACVIYDKSVYRLFTGFGALSDEDVDTINMIGLYNGGKDGGVVCLKNEDGYVDLIYEKMGGKVRGNERYTRLDTYPFSTNLSVFRYYAEAEKNREKNILSPIRNFVSDLQEYDSVKMKGVTPSNYDSRMHKRYLFAKSLIEK